MPDQEQEPKHHDFHAEASVLEGHLTLPLVQDIKTQAYANLPVKGGYIAQHESDYRLESVISFRKAYTQVAGNPGSKPGHKWTTLSTSVIEGLNILDVVTADRIVAQVSLDHPPDGYIPFITFLGTRFENLKIAGKPVDVTLDLNLVGEKLAGDEPFTNSSHFRNKVAAQRVQVQAHPNLLAELVQRYTGFSRQVGDLEAVECSLVDHADYAEPGRCHGHVIHVPDFGTICLANLRLEHSDPKPSTGIPRKTLVHLTMMDIKMGCVAEGETGVGVTKTNGATMP
jgi:hypothetical protein